MPHQCTSCGRTFADGSKEMLSGCPDCGGNKFQFSPGGFDEEPTAEGSVFTPASDSAPGAAEATAPGSSGASVEPSDPPDRPGDAVTRTVGSAAATVRDIVGGTTSADATDARPPESTDPSPPEPDEDSETVESEPDRLATGFSDVEPGSDDDIIVAEETTLEDTAQADARSAMAGPDDLPPTESEEVETDVAESHDAKSTDSRSDEVQRESDERTTVEEPDAEQADRPDLSTLREELNDQFESIRVVEPGQYELNLMELYDREAYIIALQEDGRYSIRMPDSWGEADA